MAILQVKTDVALETEECCACGVTFAMPAGLRRKFASNGGTFYCPVGHAQHYTEPDVEVLKRKLRQANQRASDLESQLNGALDNLAENKKELRRARRRANVGLCPYCRRHFANVERHIHTKHPEELAKQ